MPVHGKNLLLDLERRVFAQVLDQLVVEAGRLAVLDEFERAKIVLGGHDQPRFLISSRLAACRAPPNIATANWAATKPSNKRREKDLRKVIEDFGMISVLCDG